MTPLFIALPDKLPSGHRVLTRKRQQACRVPPSTVNHLCRVPRRSQPRDPHVDHGHKIISHEARSSGVPASQGKG